MSKKRLAGIGVLVLASGGCALTYRTDPQFQNWLNQAEARCIPRYGVLPIQTDEQRNLFLNMTYRAYYHDLPREAYADRLKILYPRNGLTVDCLASAMPPR